MSAALIRVLRGLRQDRFFLALLAVLVLLSLWQPAQVGRYGSLVDWPTIAALGGLLLLTKGLELSGALHRSGRMLVEAMASERAAALTLVSVAAVLSTVLTNDVALFVVVPLTLNFCRLTGMSAARLVIFEALAVNAGSALTPIGNPQNIFLWQLAQVPFGEFVRHQAPLVAVLMAALLLLTAVVFRRQPLRVREHEAVPVDRVLLGVSLALYLPFLVATDLQQAGWAAAGVLLMFLVLRPRVVADLDWGLLLVFMLMFIDLRLIAGQGAVQSLMQGLGLDGAIHLYWAGIGFSQVISNVPATIALVEFSRDWRVLAYGVNVGGFGLLVGSLANLIALRMLGERRAWLHFHVYAVPALAFAALAGYALLFLLPR
ncbi:SLC13 family permease [Roseateles sp. BYS96W]|uniref:SLC13 family permease n=1 Tax=Pelomonas nitida TaxID=3299027 RepID=A0ABW7G4Z4_9BURK